LQSFENHFELMHNTRTTHKIRAGSDLWHDIQYICTNKRTDSSLANPLGGAHSSLPQILLVTCRMNTVCIAYTGWEQGYAKYAQH